MISLNKTLLVGNLVGDIEVKHGKNSGVAYTRFTIASDTPKNSQGQSKANYASCVAFAHNAENLGKVGHKGRLVYVDGHIRTDKYTNKAGKDVYTMNVQVDKFEMLDSNNHKQTAPQSNESSQNQEADFTNSINDYSNQEQKQRAQQAPQHPQGDQEARPEPTPDDKGNNTKDDKKQHETAKQQLEHDSKDVNISNDDLPF